MYCFSDELVTIEFVKSKMSFWSLWRVITCILKVYMYIHLSVVAFRHHVRVILWRDFARGEAICCSAIRAEPILPDREDHFLRHVRKL
jgi:hypothetical protein